MAGKQAETRDYPHNASQMRTLVDTYDGIQKQRIAAQNRARAINQGKDQGDFDFYDDLAYEFKRKEREIADRFSGLVEDHPFGPWLLAVKGIGPAMAAKTIGLIGDISTFHTASALWMYAGYGVEPVCASCKALWPVSGDEETGRKALAESCPACGGTEHKNVASRLRAGQKARFNVRLKMTLHNLAEGLIRANSPYRRVYDEAYAYYFENRPDWGSCESCKAPLAQCKDPDKHSAPGVRSRPGKGWKTGHLHAAAMRKMIKVFLAHVYESWRRIEKLPLRELYVHAVLGHEERMKPEDFVDYQLPKPKWSSNGHGEPPAVA